MTEPGSKPTGFHVHHAMCAIKKRLAQGGGITKDRKAPDQIGGYAFRGIDDADNVLCELTADAGIVLYPRVISHEWEKQTDAKGRLQYHVKEVLEIDIVSAIDGSSHMVRTVGEGIDTGDKGTGKAFSNARKQAVLAAFMIPTHGENVEEHVTEVGPAYVASQAGMLGTVPNPPPSKPKEVAAPVDEERAAIQTEEPLPKPGPAKAGRKPRAPKAEIPEEPQSLPLDSSFVEKVAQVNTFPLLYAVAQDADVTPEPHRTQFFEAIKIRAAQLFDSAQNMPEVEEGFSLVSALGSPAALKTAANNAYVRFRNGKA